MLAYAINIYLIQSGEQNRLEPAFGEFNVIPLAATNSMDILYKRLIWPGMFEKVKTICCNLS